MILLCSFFSLCRLLFIQVDIESLTRYGAALCCRRFHGSHTYDRIAEILNKIITEYEIPIQNIVATVTDNGRNFVKVFAEFGVKNIPLEIQMEVEPEDENSFISNEIIDDYFQDNEAVNLLLFLIVIWKNQDNLL